MAVSLTHLGEDVVAAIADKRAHRAAMLRVLGVGSLADAAFVDSVERFARSECRLSPHAGFTFDGASRVDVVFHIRADLAVAAEVKLGETRLSKKRVDEEFLRECWLSHRDKRIAGNMMAVLERRFPKEIPAQGLCVEIDGQAVPLSRDWRVIARSSTLKTWSVSRPAFSPQVREVDIAELVSAFGGGDAFNALVRKLLSIDYYQEWIAKRSSIGIDA